MTFDNLIALGRKAKGIGADPEDMEGVEQATKKGVGVESVGSFERLRSLGKQVKSGQLGVEPPKAKPAKAPAKKQTEQKQPQATQTVTPEAKPAQTVIPAVFSPDFDPAGDGYDYENAQRYGMKPVKDPTDGKMHWGSRAQIPQHIADKYGLPPDTGVIVKGEDHETFDLAVEGEIKAGYQMFRLAGRLWSTPVGTPLPEGAEPFDMQGYLEGAKEKFKQEPDEKDKFWLTAEADKQIAEAVEKTKSAWKTFVQRLSEAFPTHTTRLDELGRIVKPDGTPVKKPDGSDAYQLDPDVHVAPSGMVVFNDPAHDVAVDEQGREISPFPFTRTSLGLPALAGEEFTEYTHKIRIKQESDRQEKLLKMIKHSKPIELVDYTAQYAPGEFVQDVYQWLTLGLGDNEAARMNRIAKQYQKDPMLVDELDRLEFENHLAEQVIRSSEEGESIPSAVVNLAAKSVPFLAEYLVTGLAVTPMKAAGYKRVATAVEKMGVNNKWIRKAAENAGKLAVTIGGETARAFMMPSRMRTSIAEQHFPEFELSLDEKENLALAITGQGDYTYDSYKDGMIDVVIENISESSGPFLGKHLSRIWRRASVPLKRRVLRTAVGREYLKFKKGSAGMFIQTIREEGWNGPINEWLEERLGGALREAAITDEESRLATRSLPERFVLGANPGWRQGVIEALGFTLMQVPTMPYSVQARMKRGRITEARKYQRGTSEGYRPEDYLTQKEMDIYNNIPPDNSRALTKEELAVLNKFRIIPLERRQFNRALNLIENGQADRAREVADNMGDDAKALRDTIYMYSMKIDTIPDEYRNEEAARQRWAEHKKKEAEGDPIYNPRAVYGVMPNDTEESYVERTAGATYDQVEELVRNRIHTLDQQETRDGKLPGHLQYERDFLYDNRRNYDVIANIYGIKLDHESIRKLSEAEAKKSRFAAYGTEREGEIDPNVPKSEIEPSSLYEKRVRLEKISQNIHGATKAEKENAAFEFFAELNKIPHTGPQAGALAKELLGLSNEVLPENKIDGKPISSLDAIILDIPTAEAQPLSKEQRLRQEKIRKEEEEGRRQAEERKAKNILLAERKTEKEARDAERKAERERKRAEAEKKQRLDQAEGRVQEAQETKKALKPEQFDNQAEYQQELNQADLAIAQAQLELEKERADEAAIEAVEKRITEIKGKIEEGKAAVEREKKKGEFREAVHRVGKAKGRVSAVSVKTALKSGMTIGEIDKILEDFVREGILLPKQDGVYMYPQPAEWKTKETDAGTVHYLGGEEDEHGDISKPFATVRETEDFTYEIKVGGKTVFDLGDLDVAKGIAEKLYGPQNANKDLPAKVKDLSNEEIETMEVEIGFLEEAEYTDLHKAVLAEAKRRTEGEEEAEVEPPDFETMVQDATRWKGAALNADSLYGENKRARLEHSQITTKGDLDAYLMKKYGIDATTARSVSNELTKRNLEADRTASVEDFAGEEWADKALAYSKEQEPTTDDAAEDAEGEDATDAQKDAGNYKKGHFNVGGEEFTVENKQGDLRNPAWPALPFIYGYVRKTEGKDGDHIDIAYKPGVPISELPNKPVFVVQQLLKKTGKLDEHKVFVGYDTAEEVIEAYESAYTTDAPVKLGNVDEMEWEEWREWAHSDQPKTDVARKEFVFEATTPKSEATVKGEYRLVPISDLITSDQKEYDQKLQPRTRTSVASEEQITGIVNRFNPTRLLANPVTSAGSPIVTESNNVLSGNGRVMALRRIAENHPDKWKAYKDTIAEFAEDHGIDATKVKEGKYVLVRVITDTGGASLEDIAEWSNRSEILERGPAEQAEADGKSILDNNLMRIFNPDAKGNILAASNRPFNNEFIRLTGADNLRTKDGGFDKTLDTRIRRAILAALLLKSEDSRQIIQAVIERSGELNIQRNIDGLLLAAGSIFKLAQDKPDYDMSEHLGYALRDFIEVKELLRSGSIKSLKDFLAQAELVPKYSTSESNIILSLLANTPTIIGTRQFFEDIAKNANLIDTTTEDMFGEPSATVLDLIRRSALETESISQEEIGMAEARGRSASAQKQTVEGSGAKSAEAPPTLAEHVGFQFEAEGAKIGRRFGFQRHKLGESTEDLKSNFGLTKSRTATVLMVHGGPRLKGAPATTSFILLDAGVRLPENGEYFGTGYEILDSSGNKLTIQTKELDDVLARRKDYEDSGGVSPSDVTEGGPEAGTGEGSVSGEGETATPPNEGGVGGRGATTGATGKRSKRGGRRGRGATGRGAKPPVESGGAEPTGGGVSGGVGETPAGGQEPATGGVEGAGGAESEAGSGAEGQGGVGQSGEGTGAGGATGESGPDLSAIDKLLEDLKNQGQEDRGELGPDFGDIAIGLDPKKLIQVGKQLLAADPDRRPFGAWAKYLYDALHEVYGDQMLKSLKQAYVGLYKRNRDLRDRMDSPGVIQRLSDTAIKEMILEEGEAAKEQYEEAKRKQAEQEAKRKQKKSEEEKEREEAEKVEQEGQAFSVLYEPRSTMPKAGTLVPKYLQQHINNALEKIEEQKGLLEVYVAQQLGFVGEDAEVLTDEQKRKMGEAFSGEQVDALAMAFYQMEAEIPGRLPEALIIGDDTGTGKGRIAGGILLKHIKDGLKPVFVTAEDTLFTDIYRDLQDITGALGLRLPVPMIMNGAVDVMDSRNVGQVLFPRTTNREMEDFLEDYDEGLDSSIMEGRDLVLMTYGQIQSGEDPIPDDPDLSPVENRKRRRDSISKKAAKRGFLRVLVKDNGLVLDESHMASGRSSNRGEFFRELLAITGSQNDPARYVTYLSATFAKRPETMALYLRTILGRSNIPYDRLVEILEAGGIPLQEWISEEMSRAWQYVRREKDFSDVEFSFLMGNQSLPEEQRKREQANIEREVDSVTTQLRNLIRLSQMIAQLRADHKQKIINDMKQAGTWPKNKEDRPRISVSGIGFANIAHNFVNQYMLAAHVDAAVNEAINHLKMGEDETWKPLKELAGWDGKKHWNESQNWKIQRRDVGDNVTNMGYVEYINADNTVRVRFTGEGDWFARRREDPDHNIDSGQWRIDDEYKDKTVEEILKRFSKPTQKVVLTVHNTLEAAFNALNLSAGDAIPEAFGETITRAIPTLLKHKVKIEWPDNTVEESEGVYDGGIESWIRGGGAPTMSNVALAKEQLLQLVVDLPVSPIDAMRDALEKRGVKVGEMTRRSMKVVDGVLVNRTSEESDKQKTIDAFNSGKIDIVIGNTSMATGISMHASVKFADKRKRIMITVQIAPDINTQVQLYGRINRYGQVIAPELYTLTSELPAETRPAAVLLKKMRSLHANTTGKGASAMDLDIEDMINRYGDRIFYDFFYGSQSEVPQLSSGLTPREMALSIGLREDEEQEGIAKKASGRIALLPVEQQREVWNYVDPVYKALIQDLDDRGENDLKSTHMDLDAVKTEGAEIWLGYKQGDNGLLMPAIIEEYDVRNLKRPLTARQIRYLASKNRKAVSELVRAIQEKAVPWARSFDVESEKAEEAPKRRLLYKKSDTEAKRKRELTQNYQRTIAKIEADEDLNDKQKQGKKIEEKDKYITALKELTEKEKTGRKGAMGSRTRQILAGIHSTLQTILDVPEDQRTGKKLEPFLQIGRAYDVWIGSTSEGEYKSGLPLINVTYDKTANNPGARSNITLHFAVPDASRVLKLTMSRIHRIERSGGKHNARQSRIVMRAWNFNLGESRKKVKMLTGNLLHAQLWLQDKGIRANSITFTLDDGTMKRGILLPESADVNIPENQAIDRRIAHSMWKNGTLRRIVAGPVVLNVEGDEPYMDALNADGVVDFMENETVQQLTEYYDWEQVTVNDKTYYRVKVPRDNVDPLIDYLHNAFGSLSVPWVDLPPEHRDQHHDTNPHTRRPTTSPDVDMGPRADRTYHTPMDAHASTNPKDNPIPDEPYGPDDPRFLSDLENVFRLDLPELVMLARKLLDRYPRVVKKIRKIKGFYPAGLFTGRGKGDIKILASLHDSRERAARTLAHEIGHAWDWLPEETFGRGNILGKLGSLINYMRTSLPEFPSQLGNAIPQAVRDKLRKEAEKEARRQIPKKTAGRNDAIKQLTATLYQQKLKDYASKNNYFLEGEIMAELKRLTMWWKPFDISSASPKFVQYRFSTDELYADAISVFLNAPSKLRHHAPKFFQALMNWLKSKPEIWKLYQEYQQAITSGEINKVRLETSYEGFEEHTKAFDQAIKDAKATPQEKWRTFKGWIWGQSEPLAWLMREARKANKDWLDKDNPLWEWEKLAYSDGPIKLYLDDIEHEITTPLHEAGLEIKHFGAWIFLKRTESKEDRLYLANPWGLGGKPSYETEQALEAEIGAKNVQLLERLRKKLFDLREKHIFPFLKKAGAYSPELMAKIEKNVDYCTFSVTKYLKHHHGNEASGIIYKQIGTYESIGNPYEATVLKDMKLIRSAIVMIAKKQLIRWMEANSPENIYKLKNKDYRHLKTSDGAHVREPHRPPSDKMKTFLVMDEGVLTAYWIPKGVAELYEQNPLLGSQAFSALSAVAAPLKSLYTGRNPWWVLWNVQRDVRAAAIQLPGARMGLGKKGITRYVLRSIGDAWAEVIRSEPTDIVREMMRKQFLLLGQPGSMYAGGKHEGDIETILERTFETWRIRPKKRTSKPWFGKRLWDFLESWGAVWERVIKIASYKYLTEHTTLSDEEIGHLIITRAGSPNFRDGGNLRAIYNNIFLFSNAQIQGTKAAVESAVEHPIEYAMKLSIYEVMPKLLMYAASIGLLDELIRMFFDPDWDDRYKRMFDKIPSHDKALRMVIPLHETIGGEVGYFLLPHSFVGELVSGTLWHSLEAAHNDKDYLEVLGFLRGQIPFSNINPIYKTLINAASFALGEPSWDSWMNRTVLPERIMNMGPPHRNPEAAKMYGKYIFNQFFGTWAYRWPTSGFEPARGEMNRLLKSVEWGRDVPFLQPLINRIYRLSRKGEYDKLRTDPELVKMAETDAKQSWRMSKTIQEVLMEMGEKPTTAQLNAALYKAWNLAKQRGHVPEDYKLSYFKQKFKREKAYRYGDPIEREMLWSTRSQKAYLNELLEEKKF